MAAGSPTLGLWRVVTSELRVSSRETKRAVFGSLATVTVAALVAIVDAVTGSPGQEPFRLVGIVVAAIAFHLRAVAGALWHVGTEATTRPRAIGDAQALHRVMQAVPAVNAASAVLFGIAAGLFVPSLLVSWFFFVLGLGLAGVAMWTAREVLIGTRELYARALEREQAAGMAAAEATSARLAALQAQMTPHFLFNALNTVASLVRTSPIAAERCVEQLATLLRRTLDRSAHSIGTLREEVEYLGTYLALEQERWGDALRVEWTVSPDVLEREIPVMALQPVVENALEHGIGQRVDGGTVRITARAVENGAIELAVSDNGPGFATGAADGTGLGNLRRRLSTRYGAAASLTTESGGGVTTVTLRIPAPPSPSI